MSGNGDWATFLDRDGTIIFKEDYPSRPSQVRLLPGAGQAIARLNVAGAAVVVASNQSGLARGYFDEQDLSAVEEELDRQLAAEGAHVDAYYYCPHLPEGTVERYARACNCRKPAPELVLRASREMGLRLNCSYMIGDRLLDVACGRAAGVTTILVETGQKDGPPQAAEQTPHQTVPDLAAAVDWIMDSRLS